MESRFFLRFKDKETQTEFILSRKRQMMIFSIIYLFARLIINAQIILTFSISGTPSLRRFVTYTSGNVLQVCFILLFWKYPLQLYKYYAAMTMLCYQTFLFNLATDLPISQVNIEGTRNLSGVFNATMLCTVFLNCSWLITSGAILFMLWSSFIYYVVVLKFVVFPFII